MGFTKQELLIASRNQIYPLSKISGQKLLSLNEIDDMIPGFLYVSYSPDLYPNFIGESIRKSMELTMDEIISMKEQFFKTFVHEESLKQTYPLFRKFYQQKDPTKTCVGFQKIRTSRKSTKYEAYMTILKVSMSDGALVGIITKLNDLEPCTRKFERISEINAFMRKHFREFAALTKQEIEVLRLVAIGKKRKFIADLLHISVHTLDTHRKNIREKLSVNSVAEFIKYAEAFDLI